MENNNIGFVLKTLKPFKLLIMGQFLVGTIWAIDLSLRPYIIKLILNKMPTLNSYNIVSELSELVIFYLSMSLLMVCNFRFLDFIMIKTHPPLKRHICDVLMKRMMGHSLNIFQNNFAGNLANKIADVMNGIPNLLRIIINQFYSHFLAFIIAVFAVFMVNYKFAILLFIWVTFFVIGTLFFSKRIKILSDQTAEARSGIIGRLVDILKNISSVNLFAAKVFESQMLKQKLDQYVIVGQKQGWSFLFVFAFQGILFVIYQTLCFVLLISGFKDGSVTLGDFVLILTINISIVDCLWSLSSDIINFSELAGNITQGLRVALSPFEIQDKPNAKDLIVEQGKIVFDKVKFNYNHFAPLFQNKVVTIPPKQKVGLVGYSGGGKSTFVNLILRMYDVSEGQILIDEQNIKDVSQASIRSNIALIPQDPSLFHRTLMENIRYGKQNATDEQVIEAAQKAHAHEFIIQLPEKYESLVGERGVKLSGGQRQRVAIARAILKNAPVLILDEATSQLDSVTESLIQKSLLELMQNKTVIVIAHRLSTLLHMDRILVFNKGEIVEDGSHKELIAKNGLYKTLWDEQVGGFLVDI